MYVLGGEAGSYRERGADPSPSPPLADFAGLSPLFDACGRGFAGVVAVVLLAGAHPNTPCGKDNDTPLHEAAFHGYLQVRTITRCSMKQLFTAISR